MAYIQGDSGNNPLYGTWRGDIIEGYAGDDTMWGGDNSDTMRGGDDNDDLFGEYGNDFLYGDSGRDYLNGGVGDDYLWGGPGRDTVDGGSGNDTMWGGTGYDTYVVTSTNDQVIEYSGEGLDIVVSHVNGYTLGANVESLLLGGTTANGNGNSLNNRLYGNDANNNLSGVGGADELLGYGGADALSGGSGSDTLTGGADFDVLTGGSASDTFKYVSASDAPTNYFLFPETINDFLPGIDNIDLSEIDANLNVRGNQAFNFIGTNDFGNSRSQTGEVRYQTTGGSVLVQVDIYGDGDYTSDLDIFLLGTTSISASDFIL
jgi:serralysin